MRVEGETESKGFVMIWLHEALGRMVGRRGRERSRWRS